MLFQIIRFSKRDCVNKLSFSKLYSWFFPEKSIKVLHFFFYFMTIYTPQKIRQCVCHDELTLIKLVYHGVCDLIENV